MSAHRRTAAAVVGAVGLGLTALLGAAGAAARPGGVWVGVPRPWLVVVVALAVALVPWAAGTAEGIRRCGGLLLPPVLLLAGLPLAGVHALSGPPLFALTLAGVVVVAASARRRPPEAAFLPLVFLVLVVFGARANVQVGPQGDEPHYLMVADSLWRDGDVSLERDYAERRYTVFHDEPLAPHYRVRGKNGAIYSLHAVGLSVLILPAWVLAGYPGVTVFMALLAALVAREVREWVRALGGHEELALAAGWLVALTPPLAHYAGLVFTEVPAALALSFGLRKGREEGLGTPGAIAVGAAAAVLPWLNVRYVPLAALVVAHALWRQRGTRSALAVLGPALLSAVGIAAYHQALYGFWDPRRVYGRRPELSFGRLGEGLPGLLLDQEFGLLVYAPVLVLALPGLLQWWRRDRRAALVALTAVAVVALTAGSWPMWRGGFNPPGRFLVPIAPLLAVAVALVVQRRGLTAGTALLIGWSLFAGLAGGVEPRLVHRDRDGTAPLFREMSGAREWTGLMPGYVLADPDRHRLAAVWALALLVALPWRSRTASGPRLAVAGLGLIVAAQLAATLSLAKTGDRDAVRLVGKPALAVPGWRLDRESPAAWGPEALEWGPLYEAHRHPAGAEIGRRLPLPAGRYRLLVRAGDVGATGPAPELEIAPDRPGAPSQLVSLAPADGRLSGSFAVRPGERAVSLRLWGGGPVLVQELRLTLQPSGAEPVQSSRRGA
jgi:hypothetical protein